MEFGAHRTAARVVRPPAFDYDAKHFTANDRDFHAYFFTKNRLETPVAPAATVAVFFCIGFIHSNAKKAAFDGLFCWLVFKNLREKIRRRRPQTDRGNT